MINDKSFRLLTWGPSTSRFYFQLKVKQSDQAMTCIDLRQVISQFVFIIPYSHYSSQAITKFLGLLCLCETCWTLTLHIVWTPCYLAMSNQTFLSSRQPFWSVSLLYTMYHGHFNFWHVAVSCPCKCRIRAT